MQDDFKVKYCCDCKYHIKNEVSPTYRNIKGLPLKKPRKQFVYYCKNEEAIHNANQFDLLGTRCETVRYNLCGYFAKFFENL